MSIFLSVLLPVVFLLFEVALVGLVPQLAGPAAYMLMVAAPLLAAAACAWRGRAELAPARAAWFVLAVGLATWSLGAFSNLWEELVLGHSNLMYRNSALGFNLAAVPIAFLIASEWQPAGRQLVRVIDAVHALTLGVAFFLLAWALLTVRGEPDLLGVAVMIGLEDAENAFLIVGALVRWLAADDDAERDLFRSLTIYLAVYAALIVLNNHVIAGDLRFGPEYGLLITIAFALMAAFALRGPVTVMPLHPWPGLVRAVRVASPLVLAGALLIVALFLIRVNYTAGVAAILIAVVGYGLRNTVAQMTHIERGDTLQRERSELQTLAWTDALTGVPNRYFLDQALDRVWRRDLRTSRPLAVLMIDIDHFKLLNDRFGHPTGDACLRQVARVLQEALVRPGDVLARYGGEEFIALVQDADAAGGHVVAERLRSAVEGLRIEHPDSPFGVVTVSVGVAGATPAGDAAATGLVKAADRALYEAKCAGRNQVRSLPADAA
jgi:diguanylate cyclase (GGDEF)-like protein